MKNIIVIPILIVNLALLFGCGNKSSNQHSDKASKINVANTKKQSISQTLKAKNLRFNKTQ